MAELVDIKDISGNIRLSTPINEGSKRKFQLMSSDYITLKFSLAEPVYFRLGDYIDDENIGFLARMQSGDLAKSFVKRPYKSKTEQRKKLA